MRNRHRWVYQMTGLPGWMRYGFSHGWRGGYPSIMGFGPRYLRLGSHPPIPQDQTTLSPDQNTVLPGFSSLYDPWGMAVLTPEEELNFMKIEAEQLEDQLYAIEKRIKELEEKE